MLCEGSSELNRKQNRFTVVSTDCNSQDKVNKSIPTASFNDFLGPKLISAAFIRDLKHNMVPSIGEICS